MPEGTMHAPLAEAKPASAATLLAPPAVALALPAVPPLPSQRLSLAMADPARRQAPAPRMSAPWHQDGAEARISSDATVRALSEPGALFNGAGYWVGRGVFSGSLVRRLLDAAYGAVPLDPSLGGLVNPHGLSAAPAVCGMSLDLLCGSRMGSLLGCLDSTAGRHVLLRSEMHLLLPFRAPQQDGYSFDSHPAGQVIGAWIALEDVEEAAGRPFVLEGSQRHGISAAETALARRDYLDGVSGWLSNRMDKVRSPALRRGDVLFWHGHAVLGTLPRTVRGLTAGSLIAWYAPLGSGVRGRDGAALPGPHPHVAMGADPRLAAGVVGHFQSAGRVG